MTDETTDQQPHESATAQYGVGPFSIREVALTGVWLVAFVVSFFSLTTSGFSSVWTSGLLWILTIGVPTVAVFLVVLRRLSPEGIRRVGSLGIDQFASVAFTVSAVLWLQIVWETVAIVNAGGFWLRSWVMWVEFILMLAGVVLTVFAPLLPVVGEDFRDRREVPAHRLARPTRPVVPRPRAPRRQAPTDAPDAATPAYAPADGALVADESPQYEALQDRGARYEAALHDAPDDDEKPDATSIFDAVAAQEPDRSPQPFWALAPTERDVVDETGAPLFRIGPTAWALVIEDRGALYIVRHEDGRIGYLHDVSDVTRG